jgi:ankyrin repeat protein
MNPFREILTAVKAGDYDLVVELLDDDPTLATATSVLGAQPIHAAHFGGHQRIFNLLVSRGVKVDFFLAAELGLLTEADAASAKAFSADGSTALHRACYWGQVPVARLLLDNGADPNAVTQDDFLQIAPLGCAVATADVPNPSDDEDVVLELVELLIARGANVNGRRRDGLTALHSAAWRGHRRVLQTLLAQGADRTIQGYAGEGPHSGQTAAQVAESQGHDEAAALLVRSPGHSRKAD